jgi:hypothetical protein
MEGIRLLFSRYTTYEDGTDRVFRNFGTEIQMQGNHPEERIQPLENRKL